MKKSDAGCDPVHSGQSHIRAIVGRCLGRMSMNNGLYSVQIETLDGVNEKASGVLILRDGMMFGGGPYLYYTGSYSCSEGRVKGGLVLNQHTPYPTGSRHFFSGRDIGVGVSGTYQDDSAELFCTALVRNKSVSLHAKIRRLETE